MHKFGERVRDLRNAAHESPVHLCIGDGRRFDGMEHETLGKRNQVSDVARRYSALLVEQSFRVSGGEWSFTRIRPY
jgi:hypothetical protein